jgi:hypothetical protein
MATEEQTDLAALSLDELEAELLLRALAAMRAEGGPAVPRNRGRRGRYPWLPKSQPARALRQ